MANVTTIKATPELKAGVVPPELRSRAKELAADFLFKDIVDAQSKDLVHITNAWVLSNKIVDAVMDLASQEWPDEPYTKKFERVPALSMENREYLTVELNVPRALHDLLVFHLGSILGTIKRSIITPEHPVNTLQSLVHEPKVSITTIQTLDGNPVHKKSAARAEFRSRMVQTPELWSFGLEKEMAVLGDLIDVCWYLLSGIGYLGRQDRFEIPRKDKLVTFREKMFARVGGAEAETKAAAHDDASTGAASEKPGEEASALVEGSPVGGEAVSEQPTSPGSQQQTKGEGEAEAEADTQDFSDFVSVQSNGPTDPNHGRRTSWFGW